MLRSWKLTLREMGSLLELFLIASVMIGGAKRRESANELFDEMTVREVKGRCKGEGKGREIGGQMRFLGNWRRRGSQRERGRGERGEREREMRAPSEHGEFNRPFKFENVGFVRF